MIAARQIAFGKAAGAKKPYDAEVEWIGFSVTNNADARNTDIVVEGVEWDSFSINIKIPSTSLVGYRACAGGPYIYSGCNRIGFALERTYRGGASFMGIADGISVPTDRFVLHESPSPTKLYWNIDGVEYPVARCANTGGVFRVFSSEGTSTMGYYVSSCKLFKNGETTLDLIPVRKGNIGYMYDRVSGQLFGNQGTGEFVLGPDVIDYTAKDYVQDGLIRMLDSIETTGFGETNYDDGTVVKNLATGADSGVVIGTNVIKNETTFGVVENLSNIVFKEAITDVSSAFSNNSFTLEFYGLIPNGVVGVYDTSADSYRYRLLSIKFESSNKARFYCGDSYTDVAVDMAALHTFSLVRNGSECIAYVDGNAVATFQASVSVVPNLLGFYLYQNQAFGSYRFFSRALNDTEVFSNASIDKARFGL